MIFDIVKIKFAAYTLIVGLAIGYFGGWHFEHDKRISFEAATKAVGQAQEDRAVRIAKDDKGRKQRADKENTKLRADVADLGKRLRVARARGGILPAPPAGAASISYCASRDELERALQRFDAGTTGLIAEGDGYRVDVGTVKVWYEDASRARR